ncbi:MAG: EthD family reductase [Ignavibacteria bacterium]|jgi:uncharacterized protein (TIGR02118 family)
MVKLTSLYKTPPDIELFEKHYFNDYLPLVRKINGLVKVETTRFSGLQGGDTKYYMMDEMYFENMDRLNEAMGSPEGKRASRELMNFAQNFVVLLYGDVY